MSGYIESDPVTSDATSEIFSSANRKIRITNTLFRQKYFLLTLLPGIRIFCTVEYCGLAAAAAKNCCGVCIVDETAVGVCNSPGMPIWAICAMAGFELGYTTFWYKIC